MMKRQIAFIIALATLAAGESGLDHIIKTLDAYVGVILLITSAVIITLMVLMLFFLQSISEHLNWIRRMK
jgi:hypothetical protein